MFCPATARAEWYSRCITSHQNCGVCSRLLSFHYIDQQELNLGALHHSLNKSPSFKPGMSSTCGKRYKHPSCMCHPSATLFRMDGGCHVEVQSYFAAPHCTAGWVGFTSSHSGARKDDLFQDKSYGSRHTIRQEITINMASLD